MHCVGSEGHKDENDVPDFKSLSVSSTGPEIFQIACRIQRKHRFRNRLHREPTVGASEKEAWRHGSADGDFSYRVFSSTRK